MVRSCVNGGDSKRWQVQTVSSSSSLSSRGVAVVASMQKESVQEVSSLESRRDVCEGDQPHALSGGANPSLERHMSDQIQGCIKRPTFGRTLECKLEGVEIIERRAFELCSIGSEHLSL